MEEVKSMLRAVLMSSKGGVPADILQKDYQDITLEPLPYRKFGYSNLESFMQNIPDVVQIRRQKGEIMYHAVANKETAHIQALVSKQKSTKKKQKLKAPRRRPRPKSNTFRPPPWDTRPPPFDGPPRPFPGSFQPPMQQNMRNFQVVVQNRNSGGPGLDRKRFFKVDGQFPRSFQQAMKAANTEWQENTYRPRERFELPPRFRKQRGENDFENRPPLLQLPPTSPVTGFQNQRPLIAGGINQSPQPTGFQNQRPLMAGNINQNPQSTGFQNQRPLMAGDMNQNPQSIGSANLPQKSMPTGSFQQNQKPTVPHPPRKQEKKIFKAMPDGKKYEDILLKFAKENNFALEFETIPTRRKGYASSVTIFGNVYGSGDVFNSVKESRYAASLTACTELRLLPDVGSKVQPSANTSISVNVLKTRVKELLSTKTTGFWATNLVGEYKDKFKEEPPDDLLDLIQQWTDIALVESMVGDKKIIYPAKEETPKGPSPSSVPDTNKDLQIPRGKPLPLETKITVYMTYLHDCGYFCVHSEDSPIDKIGIKLETVDKKPIPHKEDLSEGMYVAAIFSGSWSRAEIIGISPDGGNYEVLYVDFGNTDHCPLSSLRWLNEDIASYPVQAIYCSLHGLIPVQGDEWDQKSTEKFGVIGSDQTFVAVTKSYKADGVCSLELFLDGDSNTSVNQMLVQSGFAKSATGAQGSEFNIDESEPDILDFPEEDQWDVYVSFINSSTNSVMIRLIGEQYSDKLDDMEAKLKDIFHKSDDKNPEIIVGGVYIAYVEELFHRVRVLNINGKKVECLYLDHGDTDELLPVELRPMDPKINCLLPYQAIEVSLYGLEEIAENVTTVEKLFDLALGKTCIAEIVARGAVPSVILFDTQEEDEEIDINETIAKAVQREAETSLLTSAGSNPQSKESSPMFPRRDMTADATQDRKPLTVTSNKLMKQDSSDSWETEEEDEVTIPQTKKLNNKDLNSNIKKSPSKTTNPKNFPTSGSVVRDPASCAQLPSNKIPGQNSMSKSDKGVGLPPKSDSDYKKAPISAEGTDISSQENTDSVIETLSNLKMNQDVKPKLYTWGKSGGDSVSCDSVGGGEGAKGDVHWDITEYNNRPLPLYYKIPNVGEYCDIHVIGLYDPSNFVCVPYETKMEQDQLLRDMIEYFNTTETEIFFNKEDFKKGHLYAGHQGGAWYRIILNNTVSEALVSVYLCDIGEYTAMTFEEIQPLPQKFWNLPIQAFKAKLNAIKPSDGVQFWSEAAKYKFSQMVSQKDLVALICGVGENKVISMRLIDTSTDRDVCVDEELLALGLAEKGSL